MRMARQRERTLEQLMLAFAFSAVSFWTLNVLQWYANGSISPVLLIAYIVIVPPCAIAFYIALPRHKRPFASLKTLSSTAAEMAWFSRGRKPHS
jgi:hypothetical protein